MSDVIGRDAERAMVATALAAGRGAWVTGTRACGASSLLRAVADDARAAGSDVRHVVASDATTPLATAGLLVGSSPTIGGLGAGLRAQGIDLVVIDDAEAIDADSFEALRLAVLDRAVALVLGSTRRPVPAALTWLASSGTLDRIELAPLPAPAIDRIVRRLRPGPAPDGELVRALHLDAGGRPGFVVGLLDPEPTAAIAVDGGRLRLRADLPVTPALAARVETVTASISPAARAAFATLGVAGPVPLPLALALGDVDSLSELEAADLIAVDTDDPAAPTVRPVVPAVARAVVAALGTFGRRAVADLLAAHADAAPDALGTWWRHLAGNPVSPDDLAAAARTWRRHGDLGRARHLAAAAHAAGHVAAGLVLAEIHSAQGRRRDAAALLAATVEAQPDDDELAWLAIFELATLQLWNLGDGEGALRSAATIAARASGHPLAGLARGALASAQTYTGDPTAALATTDGWTDDPLGGELVGQVRAVALALVGHTHEAEDEARRAFALGIERQSGGGGLGGPDPEIHANTIALAAVVGGRLGDLGAFLDERYAASLDPGVHTGWVALARTRGAFAVGDLAAAGRHAAEAAARFADLDNQPPRRWALAGVALAAAQRGDTAAAQAALAELDAVAAPAVTFLECDVARARAWTEADRDLDRARGELIRAAADASGRGLQTLAAEAWFDVARLGDPARAAVELDGLALDLDDRWSGPRCDLAHGLADADAPRIERAIAGFTTIGAHLAAAEAAAALVAVGRRHHDRGTIRTALGHLGRALDVVGTARTPLIRAAAATELSPREREVAAFAAEGWTSREIADRLGVSSRTVDNLLQRAYTKLGVAGRADLRSALADGTSGPDRRTPP